MSGPFLLAQLSDPHIGARWADADPVAGLAAAVEAVRSVRPRPDAVLVSGDLADNATDDEYEQAGALLASLGVPVYVVSGNHELATAPAQLTLVAMHHPPLVTGVPAWDDFGLPAGDRRALSDVIVRHPQVRRIVAGHFHRTITGDLAGRPVLSVPSTYVQARLSLGSHELELADEPAGFALHAVVDGEVVSHVQPVQ